MSDTPGDLAPSDGTERHVQLDPRTAEQLKADTATTRADLARQQLDLQTTLDAARADMERKRAELEEQFNRQRAELEARIAPMRAELERLTEVAWTVDLYLGRREEVTLIQDGEPASADTPITIRQNVLAADEESLILGEEAEFDYRAMDTFVSWLTSDPAHRDRIIPDARGVVVVVPTRQLRDYGNAFENAAREEANLRPHWIIRNGERLYLMVLDAKVKVAERILPSRDEFTRYFYGWDSKPLKPGSAEWVRAEEKADDVKRHYMRLMLILQGIVDRSVAFHPLPEGGVNLMSVTAQDLGHVVLLNENDLALTDGRPSFRDWQRGLNAQLRPGIRVVLGHGIGQHSYDHGYRNSRVSPATASHPPTGKPIAIEGKRDAFFVVRYHRTDEVWRPVEKTTERGYRYRSEELGVPEKRASALISADDFWVLPFDLCDVADLEYYLNSRGARRNYQAMVPVIRAAINAKRAEAEAEAPLRQLLRAQIALRWPDATDQIVDDELADLIRWWKTGNKFARTLAGDATVEAEATTAILKEWRKRQDAKPDPDAVAKVVEAAKRFPNVLVVAYTRGKKFVAYTPSDIEQGPWVNETIFDRHGTIIGGRDWITIAPITLSTMQVLHTTPAWTMWDKYPEVNHWLTGPERDAIIDELRATPGFGERMFLVTERAESGPRHPRGLTGWAWRDGVNVADYDAYNTAMQGYDNHGMDAFIIRRTLTWARGNDGKITTSTANTTEKWDEFSKMHSTVERPFTDRKPGVPLTGYSPVIAWQSDDLARVLEIADGHREIRHRESEQEWRERQAAGTLAQKWTAGLRAAYLARLEAQARVEFEEDYRTDAKGDADLWKHHLKTLQLDRKIPPVSTNVDDMFRTLARNSINAVGKTLPELVDVYATLVTSTSKTPGEKDLEPWGDLTILDTTTEQ